MRLALGKISWDQRNIPSKAYKAQKAKQPDRDGTSLLRQTSWFIDLLCVAKVGNTSIAWYRSVGLEILCVGQSFSQRIILSLQLFRERF